MVIVLTLIARKLYAKKSGIAHNLGVSLLFIGVAGLLLLCCTSNSPLFSHQVWVDLNVYARVGRAGTHGLVLYRDIFDHKGPFFLLTVAMFIRVSDTSLTGIYLLQSVCLGLSMFFLFKTAILFLGRCSSSVCALFLPFFVLGGSVYKQGGGSPDEFMLPLFTGSIYLLILWDQRKKTGEDSGFVRIASFLLGLFIGIAGLTKINMALFLGMAAGVILLQDLLNKEIIKAFRFAGFMILGASVAAIPCAIYFIATKSFSDFIDAYIKFNFLYANINNNMGLGEFVHNLCTLFCRNAFLGITCALVGIFGLFYRKRISGYLYGSLLVLQLSMILSSFAGNRFYLYYLIPFSCFFSLGVIGIIVLIRPWFPRLAGNHKKICILATAAGCAIVVAAILLNGFIFVNRFSVRSDKGIENAAGAISSDWKTHGGSGNPVILMYYSFDCGIYMKLGLYPTFKYFYLPGVDLDQFPEYGEVQTRYVESGDADYICILLLSSDPVDVIDKMNSEYKYLGIIPYLEEPHFNRTIYIHIFSKT